MVKAFWLKINQKQRGICFGLAAIVMYVFFSMVSIFALVSVGILVIGGYTLYSLWKSRNEDAEFEALRESRWRAFASDKEYSYRTGYSSIALDMKKQWVYLEYFNQDKSYHFRDIRSCQYWFGVFYVRVKDINHPEWSIAMSETEGKQWEEIFRQFVFHN